MDLRFKPYNLLLEPLHTVLCRLQVLGHGQGLACLYVALHLHPHLADQVCISVSAVRVRLTVRCRSPW